MTSQSMASIRSSCAGRLPCSEAAAQPREAKHANLLDLQDRPAGYSWHILAQDFFLCQMMISEIAIDSSNINMFRQLPHCAGT